MSKKKPALETQAGFWHWEQAVNLGKFFIFILVFSVDRVHRRVMLLFPGPAIKHFLLGGLVHFFRGKENRGSPLEAARGIDR